MTSELYLFIVFSLNYAQAQLLFLPIVAEPEIIHSEKSYECNCDFIYEEHDLVCGSNGLTYTNPSYLYCERKCKYPNLRTVHKGACGVDDTKLQNFTITKYIEIERRQEQPSQFKPKILNKCPCKINSEYSPVCGSNGITYENLSKLQCDKKCKQPKLNLVRYGLCREEEYFNDPLPFLTDAVSSCSCGYGTELDPVCGTDGYTYPNPSALTCVMACNNPSVRIVHYGRCRSDQRPHNVGAVRCKCASTSEYYHPICADNGVTYDNLSLFYCAQECLNRSMKIVAEYPCRNYLDIEERKL